MQTISNNLIENRQIRVFISSTFRDMEDERNYLVKRVFPILKEKAARRSVSLVAVDLRWGITEEESRNGKVLDICLKEIDNTYPFFIGIVGNRYGWCPRPEDTCQVCNQYEWLEDDLASGLSVTEMEMQYGVLRNPRNVNAFFYIKQQEDLSAEEDNPDKLKKLKERIRSNGRYPVSEYSSVEDLGKQVEAAFDNLLDRLFPEETLREEDKERLEHMTYFFKLCRFYVPDETGFSVLSDFLAGRSNRCIIGGQTGTGKSALVANWARTFVNLEKYQLVYRVIGTGKEGCNADRIITRLEGEAAEKAHPVLIVDYAEYPSFGRNEFLLRSYLQFNKSQDGQPRAIHSYEKIILVIPGSLEGVDIEPGDVCYEVPSHDEMEYWRFFINAYLRVFRKKLTDSQVIRIVGTPLLRNASLMKIFLDEIISFGSYEQLDEHIGFLLDASSRDDFYQNVLYLLEQEFGEELIRFSLCLMAVSRNGIHEDLMIKATGTTQVQWSQLYNTLKEQLISTEGRIRLDERALASAVSKKYELFENRSGADKYREKLLYALASEKTPYSFSETCFQLQLLGRFDELYALIERFAEYGESESASIQIMYEIMDVELGLIWGSDAISGVLSHLLPKVFTFLIRQEQTDDDLVRDVLHHIIHEIPFLLQDSEASDQDLSRFTELLTLSEDFLVTMTEKATDERIKLRLIDGLAELNEETASSAYYGLAEKYYRGENYSIDLDKAAKLYTKAAECGHVKAQQKLSHLYSKGLGVQKDLEKAIIWNGKALKQLMKIYGEKHRLTILCYNAQAWFYFLNGNYETALKHSLKATRSFPDDMKPVQKANCLDTLANIYEALHCQSDAIKSYELCLELYRNLFGDNDSRCETLANKIKELNESNSHSS